MNYNDEEYEYFFDIPTNTKNDVNGFYKYIESQDWIKSKKQALETCQFYLNNTKDIINNNHVWTLVRGEVQSGKTNNLIATAYNFFKEGNVIYYLSGSLNDLNEQNITRFNEAFKHFEYEVQSFNAKGGKINYHQFKTLLNNNKRIFFAGIKNSDYFNDIVHDLNDLLDDKLKLLIIIDEADDTSNSLKWKKSLDSKINNLEGRVQVIDITATPYKNLYNEQGKYDNMVQLTSPDAYSGIRQFFPNYNVIDDKGHELVNYEKEIILKVTEFLLKNIKTTKTMLINVIHTKKGHEEIHTLLNKYFMEITKNDYLHIKNKWEINTISSNEFTQLKSFLLKYYPKLLKILNSKEDPSTQKSNDNLPTIIIGSKKMDRGITFKNIDSQILISLNKGEKLSPWKILQQSRWLGYNDPKELNITMNESVWNAFGEIIETENYLDSFNIKKDEFKTWFDKRKYQYITIHEDKENNE